MASASSAISPGAGFGPKLTLLACETAEEYVFAELCEALTLSLAAENEAHSLGDGGKLQCVEMLDSPVARSRQLRHDEITN